MYRNETIIRRAEQSRAEQSKDLTIQIIRALCIIAVVLIHTFPSGLPQLFIRPFINFAVGSFIFLSGYLTKEDTWNKGKMWKRIRRVLFSYIIWTSVYSMPNPHRFLINLVTASSAPQMYYVLVYIQLVLLTTLCLKMLKRRNGALLMIISPLSFLVKYIQTFGGISLPGFINTIYGISFLPWIWYYIFGMIMQKLGDKKLRVRPVIMMLAISICLQMLEGFAWYKAGDSNCGTQMKITSLITTSLACLIWREMIICNHNPKLRGKNRYQFLVTIGNYSFGIYLSHIV